MMFTPVSYHTVKCRGCGKHYTPSPAWPNWFYCGSHCAAVRREEVEASKPKEQDDEDQQS